MSYADAIRRQAEDAPRAALPAVVKALWQAFSAGQLTEAEAEGLSALIELRQRVAADRRDIPRDGDAVSLAATGPARRHGSRPRTDASLDRRRRWAASGRLPPQLAAHFTPAEQAALALVAAETARRGDCRLAVPHLAAVAGVSETTVRKALREAKKLGLVTVEERKVTGWRNLPNVVRIISAEWTAWLRLARRGDPPSRHGQGHPSLPKGGGCRLAKGTPTEVLTLQESRPAERSEGCRRAAVDLTRSALSRIRAGGGARQAMR